MRPTRHWRVKGRTGYEPHERAQPRQARVHRPPDNSWTVGVQLRSRGSLDADIWEGTATELADRDAIIVNPTGGWWRENIAQGHVGEAVRQSGVARDEIFVTTKLWVSEYRYVGAKCRHSGREAGGTTPVL